MLELNQSLIFQIVLFLVLWWLLKTLWFDPALRLVKERTRRSEGAVAEAEKLQGETARMREQHTAAVEQARREAQAEVQALLREAEQEHKRMLGEANDAAQRTLAEVRTRVAEEVAEARRALRGDVEGIAREIAHAVVGRTV